MADRNLQLALTIKALVEGAQSIEDLSAKLEELGRDAKAAEAPADALGQDLKAVATAAQQADTALEGVAGATQQTGKAAKAASDPMAQLRARMQEIRDQRNPMDEFNRGLTQTEQAVRPVPGMLEQLKGMAAQLAATFLTAKEALDLNDRFTALQRGFTAVTGSAEATQESLNFVRDVADRLGVGVLDLGQNFLKLTAAAKGTQLEGAATEQIFSSLTGALSTVGASTGDVENALNAVAQMMSKGVISAEELRGQLGDVLPGAAQQAAAALGKSTAEFNKMLESGQVLANDFLPKFAAQLNKTFGDGKTQVESFSASWNRLLNQLSDLATGPVGTGLTKFISTTTEGLGLLARGAGFVSDAVGAAGKALGGFAAGEATAATRDLGQAVVDASVKLFGFKTEAEAATERKKQMAAELRNLTPEVDRFQDAVARKELKELPESLQAALAEFKKTGDAAAAATAAVKDFMTAPAENLTLDGILKLATSLKAVGTEAQGAAILISTTLGEQLSKLTTEQLAALEAQTRKAMAAASDGSAASRAAFAELGQVLESLVLARLQRLGVDGPEALTGLSVAAKTAIADFTALATTGNLTGEAIKRAFEGALAQLDNASELEAFRQKIIALGQDGTLTGAQVERALLLIRQRVQEVSNDAAFAVLTQRFADLREETERGIEASEREAAVRRTQIAAAIELATAKGNEAEAARLSAEAAREEVAAAEERIQQLDQQQGQIERHINLLYEQANADGIYTEAEREVIEALKDKATATAQEIAGIEAKLPLLDREAQQAAIMAGPIGDLTRLYAEQTAEHERAAAAADSYYDAQVKEVDAAIRVAKAKGDEAEASELLEKKQDILIEQAYARARALATEAVDARNAVEVKKLEAAADGVVTQAELEQIAVLENLVIAKQNAAVAAETNADAMKEEADAAESATESTEELSKTAADADRSFKETATDLNKLNMAYATFRNETAGGLGFDAVDAFGQMIRQIEGSIEAATEATEKLNATGLDGLNGGLRLADVQLSRLAKDLQDSRSYLDEAAHAAGDDLVDALEEAREAAADLREELAGVAKDYSQKIFELTASEIEVMEAERDAKLAELKAKYELAGNSASQAYQDAQSAVMEYYRIKIAQERADAENSTRTTTTANTVKDAWAGAADEIERAKTAISGINAADLNNVIGQIGKVTGAAQQLRSVL